MEFEIFLIITTYILMNFFIICLIFTFRYLIFSVVFSDYYYYSLHLVLFDIYLLFNIYAFFLF